jgi:hypothetical protein
MAERTWLCVNLITGVVVLGELKEIINANCERIDNEW